MCDVDADKPFICSAAGCGMRFTNEDHLNVHMKKHEMSLAVHSGGPSSSSGLHVADQTPTPTKFLKNCEEIGLFQELSKNPFEEAFKKASDVDGIPPIPGPQSNELNTPVLPSLSDKALGVFGLHEVDKAVQSPTSSTAGLLRQNPTTAGFALDLSGQRSREKVPMLPSSTTTEHEDARVISVADSTLSPSKSLPSVIPVVSATDVLMGQEMELSHYSGNQMMDDLDMTSAEAAVPQSTAVTQQMLVTSPHMHSSNSSSSSSSSTASPPAQDQQACTMQVYLQLPTGQTVPVHIPATISTTLPETPDNQQQQTPAQQTTAMLPTQTQTADLGTHLGGTPATSPSASSSSTSLKQRLKQTLQAQQQSIVSPCSSVKSEPGMDITTLHSPVSTTHLLLKSSSMDFSLSDLEPISKRPKNGSIDTDDPMERRQKFLERNRAAAARCRHKRKQWISNLERKAEELQQTNSKLQGEVGLLKGEVAQLKTLLLAHQNCPITMQQQSEGQLALQTISMVESSPSVPFDIAQLINTSTSTTLTPVDSQEFGAIDAAAFAVDIASEK